MAFSNSTMTAQDLKETLEHNLKDTVNITDRTILDGLNKALSIYQRAERQVFQDRYKLITGIIAVPQTGYDLSLLVDASNYHEGFHVYRDIIRERDLLPLTELGSSELGYYILGDGKLYVSPETVVGQSVVITYTRKSTKFALSSTLSTVTLPIDQEAEYLIERFVESEFYRREGQMDLANEARTEFDAELARYFTKPAKAVTL